MNPRELSKIKNKHPELTENDLKKFQRKLQKEAKTLEALIESLRKEEVEIRETKEMSADPSDSARQYEAHDRIYSQLEETEKRLEQVKRALKRLETGAGYGFCQKCKQPIEKGRIEFDPSIETCLKHAR